MSASPKAIKTFIAVVELHFPRPKFGGEETQEGAWMASMTSVLIPYDDDVLADAAARILRNRDPKQDGRFFPTPKECIQACEKSLDAKRVRDAPLLIGKQEMPHDAKVKLARDIMQAPLGQKARKEGWDTVMFHFCVDNQRAPQGQEIEACKQSARDFEAERQRCENGEGDMAKAWADYAVKMVNKAREHMDGGTP